jgi:N-methylhydantoinase B
MRMAATETAYANMAGDGTRHRPYGLFGGHEGEPHVYRLLSDGSARMLKTKEARVPVPPGSLFLIESSGGGGWGDPARRTASRRSSDLKNGFVTADPAAGSKRD